jgi:DNA sulfur modification protein DndE
MRALRLSEQAKQQLIRLKSRTGIPHWNVLCRWALCLSLRQDSPPSPVEVAADSNVEIAWGVLGGEAHEVYLAALKARVAADGLDPSDPEVLHRQLRLHVHRGIAYLATPGEVKSVADLTALATEAP